MKELLSETLAVKIPEVLSLRKEFTEPITKILLDVDDGVIDAEAISE